ncbi:cobalt ABC transporter, inner membrane subunit CbiQ [Desulforamulus reducens MI-1]|uniref:Cobalt ABC transporter, inner membrane subunit CbiQ n=1 Tax=Desulforamulus reducens (strain ATCC BAA-1160 / DSM 100696 / MI-1) TaxID=349161 RepID=A4J7M2_DESRM|nr:cobalt ECF transporter T component CbiQ [Desulforamulus reducens]ABO51075.1 cobalt ABC transporter, inner membrane subunit CbiQ [Desulforamulus reducens MI-1]
MPNMLSERLPTKTWVREIDARVKLVAVILYIFTATTLRDQHLLLTADMFMLGLLMVAGISPTYLAKKVMLILPFGGVMVSIIPFVIPGEPLLTMQLGNFTLIASRQGWEAAVLPCFRMATAFLGMVFLSASITLKDLLHALNHMKVPRIFIVLMDFTIRYIAVTLDKLDRMQTARAARGFTQGRNLWHLHTIKTLGTTVAILFLRSYERAERIYLAMLARGYTGKFHCCGHCHRVKKIDFGFGVGVISASWTIKFFDMGGYQWIMQLK